MFIHTCTYMLYRLVDKQIQIYNIFCIFFPSDIRFCIIDSNASLIKISNINNVTSCNFRYIDFLLGMHYLKEIVY